MRHTKSSLIHTHITRILPICLVFALLQPPLLAQTDEELRHTTPSGITCVVTADGLFSVQTPEGTLAKGGWQLKSAGEWAKEPRIPAVTPPKLSPSPVQERAITVLNDKKARVRHVHKNLTVTYDYIFEEEDLRINARVENHHQNADMRAVRFSGLKFAFQASPEGVMSIHKQAEVQELGFDAFHPSKINPIGGSFATADGIGVGLAPRHIGTFPDKVNWQLKRFNKNAGFRFSWAGPTLLWWQPTEGQHTYAFHHVASSTVEAEGARTFQLMMRFSDNTDWKHLLSPWKRELTASYGQVRYESSSRPIAYHPVATQPVKAAEGSDTTMWNDVPGPYGEVAEEDKDNPLGYAEGEIRLDRREAVKDYVNRIQPALKEANAMGLVFRQIGGHDPKGLEYASMFHMAPDRVHENIKDLITDRLKETDQLVGLTGRPDRYPVHVTTDRCKWLPADPDTRKHLGHMWGCRFRLTSIKKVGAKMFLLERFGDSRDEVRIMRFLRHKMQNDPKMADVQGPIHTFAEYPSDAMLFFSAGYTPVRKEDGEVTSELGQRNVRILRWLVPGADLYGLIESRDPGTVKTLAENLYSRDTGVIVYDEVLPEVATHLGNVYEENSDTEAFADADAEEPLAPTPTYPPLKSEHTEDEGGNALTYTTEDGIEFHVTESGLEKITMDDRTLAEGNWQTLSPSSRFDENRIREKSFHKTGPSSCRVIHVHDQIRTTFKYDFKGEDVTIRARVENNHPEIGINITKFGTLTFRFRGQHHKKQLTKHSKWGWLPHPDPHPGLRHMNPGRFNRLAGCYGADENYGVGATPLHTGITRTLINWAGGWGSKNRRMRYSAEKPIPPGGARTFYLQLRVSRNQDWKYLLQPYREHFRKLHGLEPRYNVDHRFVIQRMASDPSGDHWKTENSPLAYNKKRRLDTPAGARKWGNSAVETLKEAGGKGLIMWAQCGYQPRKMRFRSDFDLLPEPVKKSWPSFREEFEEAGKRFGVTVGRTHAMNYRWKWKKDNILQRPTNLEYLQTMEHRFQRMLDRGVTMFYLDVWGFHLEDIEAMRYYRDQVLGPNILTYAEGPLTDAILPYSGLRTGIRHNQKKGLHLHWGQDRVYYIMRWLMTDFGSQTYARLHPMPKETVKVGEKFDTELKKAIRLKKDQIYRWMFRHRMGVMDLWPSDNYREIQEQFLTPEGKWKEGLPPADRPGENRYREELKEKIRKEQQEKEEENLDDLMEME